MMLSKYAPMVYASIRPNHFGSWKDALTAAGLARKRSTVTVPGTTIRSFLKSAASRRKAPTSARRKWTKTANPLIATARRRFGNWGAAVERAGIDYSAIRRRRRWTHELVLEEIRQLRDVGADLRSGEIRHQHPALFAAACKARFFGSWTKALQAAEEPVATLA